MGTNYVSVSILLLNIWIQSIFKKKNIKIKLLNNSELVSKYKYYKNLIILPTKNIEEDIVVIFSLCI